MRPYLLALPMALLACGGSIKKDDLPSTPPDSGVSSPLDAGVPIAPVCLPVEAALPAVDAACPVVKPASPDAFDEALTQLGMDRCTFTLPTADYAGGRDPYRLPWYDHVHDHPVNAPAFSHRLIAGLDAAAQSKSPVAHALVLLGNRLGPSTLTVCVPDATLDAERPLVRAMVALITAAGGAPDEAALTEDAKDVPLDLQRAIARVVSAAATANTDWNELTAHLATDDLFLLMQACGIVFPGTGSGPPDMTDPNVKKLLSERWDVQKLISGGARLAAAVEGADLARFAGRRGFSFDQKTPWGRVVIHDAADDTYADDGTDAMMVLVDTGGDDTYRKPIGAVGGTQTAGGEFIHVAVAVDLAGKDFYGYPEVADRLDQGNGVTRLPSDGEGRHRKAGPTDQGAISLSQQVRQGAARLGYGMLFDLGTEGDHYRALRMSQGFGFAGVGALYDAGGDDLYEGEAGVQGAGIWGAGVLIDAGGNDTYKTYTYSQGFGYVRGAGLLYDAVGADHYLADTGIPALGGDPIYYSPQAPCDQPTGTCGNSSFSQGAGFGRRAPGAPYDSQYMSGGLGVLRDVSGDDVYTASVFAQATGYWFGTGILSDGAGDDTYDGWWYTQGSAAHAALCVFEDGAGNDRYNLTNPNNPPYATNTGQGHDYSIGWHLDLGGNDLYRGTGLGLGAGNANGGGILVNVGGDDVYTAPGGTILGGAAFDLSAMRPATLPCYGLFMDIGGQDTYTVPADPRLHPQPGNDLTWTNPRDDAPYNDKSLGVDRQTGAVTFP